MIPNGKTVSIKIIDEEKNREDEYQSVQLSLDTRKDREQLLEEISTLIKNKL